MAHDDSNTIRPFTIAVPDIQVERLMVKLREARYPMNDVVPDAGEDYGVPTAWMLKLLNAWEHGYSWPRSEAALNRLSHFTTTIDAQTIHFLHQRSPHDHARPLILIHGWPGSFHEFHRVIPSLTNPSNPDTEQPFHCIVPSLPGFTFSSTTSRKNWTVKDTARIFHALMLRLHYPTYAVQAGDWGQFVARELGANPDYASACKLVHLNYCPGALPSELAESDLTPRETQVRDRGIDWRTNHVGYAVQMRTRPQTLSFMLQDNPVGLLAFIGEKYHEASSPKVHNDEEWMDDILTTVCLYYFTNCIGSSGLIYYENVPHHQFAEYAQSEENKIKCPFAYTSYIYDTAPNSKRAVERTGNLVQYKERDYAGHFACLEDPVGVVEDVRALVKSHWSEN